MNASNWMSDDEVKSSEIGMVLMPLFDAVKWDRIGLFLVIFRIFSHFDLMNSQDIAKGLFFTYLTELKSCYSVISHHIIIHVINASQFIVYAVKTVAESDSKIPSSATTLATIHSSNATRHNCQHYAFFRVKDVQEAF